MIALLDTSEDLLVCRQELGCPVEQLLTPLTMFNRQNKRGKFAIDNGAFAGFKSGSFKGLLLREKDARSLCRFLAVPDVVAKSAHDGAARRTLEVFHHWKYKLSGWPLALVAQDGIEDLEIPWSHIEIVALILSEILPRICICGHSSPAGRIGTLGISAKLGLHVFNQ